MLRAVIVCLAVVCACEPRNSYVLPEAFAGPVVVIWEDPHGQPIGDDRRVNIPRDGVAFVRAIQPETFIARYFVRNGNKEVRLEYEEPNPSLYQAFGAKTAVGALGCSPREIKYETFLIGRTKERAKLETELLARLQQGMVSTMKHHGELHAAECFAHQPLWIFRF